MKLLESISFNYTLSFKNKEIRDKIYLIFKPEEIVEKNLFLKISKYKNKLLFKYGSTDPVKVFKSINTITEFINIIKEFFREDL